MTPEDFDYFKGRVTRFISGSNRGIRFGSSVTPKYSRLSGLIPRRSIPSQVLETIQRKPPSSVEDTIETTQRGINSLGKITLDLEQTKNNLEKIIQIIADDYKSTQEINKKEIDDYKKRVANRGRIFGKKELGDRKSDVLGTVKKYVGSFFSGTGGAIRALAMFNLLQGLLTGDPSKIIGPLLGIGLTYIPNIIGSVIGGVVGGIGPALAGRLFGGGARAAAEAAAPAAAGASRLGALGRLGGRAALIGGGIALANSLFNRPQDQSQQRLEQLTEQQKGLTGPQNLVPLPQDDLKRFERLNKKFEQALDFLLKKQGEGQPQGRGSGGGGGGAPPPAGGQIPQELLQANIPQNMAGYLTRLSYLETRLKNVPNAQGSGAMGYYQAMDAFTQEAVSASGGLNPRSSNFAESSKAVMSWIYVYNKPAYDAIMSGNYDRADSLLKGTWPSLPGGTQAQAENIQSEARKYLRGIRSQTPPAAPSLPQPAAPRPAAPRSVSALPSTPNITVAAVPVNTSPQSQASATSAGNDVVPEISTTYPENFLTTYARLIYQVV